MTKRKHTKIVKEGNYVAEVDIELVDMEEGWAPYLTVDDALKLDEVRQALREGDLKAAASKAKVFELKPAVV